jgi:sugar phosphate isomerase/epimerase
MPLPNPPYFLPVNLTRRETLKTLAVGAIALPLLRLHGASAAQSTDAAKTASGWEHGLRLGLTSYSTRTLSLDDTIAVVKLLRLSNAALFRAHCNWETATPDVCRGIADKLRAAGIALTGTGVVNLPNDEAKCRRAFENLKAAGVPTMVCKPEPAALPLVSRLAQEYDQKVAIHNHGPEDKTYPSAADAWRAIESLDARVGLCVDVGHSVRAGDDPEKVIRQYAPRLYDLHLKDTISSRGDLDFGAVEAGAGRLDLPGILKALKDIKYTGVVTYEFDKVIANPIPGLAESFGYVRGVLRMLDR